MHVLLFIDLLCTHFRFQQQQPRSTDISQAVLRNVKLHIPAHWCRASTTHCQLLARRITTTPQQTCNGANAIGTSVTPQLKEAHCVVCGGVTTQLRTKKQDKSDKVMRLLLQYIRPALNQARPNTVLDTTNALLPAVYMMGWGQLAFQDCTQVQHHDAGVCSSLIIRLNRLPPNTSHLQAVRCRVCAQASNTITRRQQQQRLHDARPNALFNNAARQALFAMP